MDQSAQKPTGVLAYIGLQCQQVVCHFLLVCVRTHGQGGSSDKALKSGVPLARIMYLLVHDT
jgi:hypothetical protein